jgi:RNA polymerase sigma-70 factor (ECF subfamily)
LGSREERFESETLPHLRALYGTACRLTRSREDAEDLVQETYLRAMRSFDRYTPGTNARAWLFTILHRARVDALRRQGRTPTTVELEADGPGAPAVQDPALAPLGGLERALQELPESLRSAVLLRDVEGFSYREIADILEVPLGTVMSRLHRGRAALRQSLGDER